MAANVVKGLPAVGVFGGSKAEFSYLEFESTPSSQ